jgi:hypothetical protein
MMIKNMETKGKVAQACQLETFAAAFLLAFNGISF